MGVNIGVLECGCSRGDWGEPENLVVTVSRSAVGEPGELLPCAEEAKAWLFNSAAPLWAQAGWNSNGTFAECLNSNAQAVPGPTRIRVQARQIFSFCTIGRLGWNGPWKDCANHALDTLTKRGRRGDGFFVHTFSLSATPSDTRADLYDHAFILFCLAHAADTLDRSDLLSLAEELMELIERHWRHPAGGFREGEIDGPPRRQNPHMHLLEASLALQKASGKRRWKTLGDEIIALCATRFIDPVSGAITEYFRDDWARLDGPDGQIVEPGHCFEWAWLFELVSGDNCTELSDRLVCHARAHGLHPTMGAVVNEIVPSGPVRDGGLRLWPQTERMKAALIRYRRTLDPVEAREAVAAFRGLQRHFATPIEGLWHERWREDEGWIVQPSPASSFYHIVGALSELLKIGAV